MKRQRPPNSFPCPHCGASVAANATVCKACGSDAETGWSEDAEARTAEIAGGYGDDDDFDYDEFVEREFPDSADSQGKWHPRRLVWTVIALLLCLALVLPFLLP